MDNETAPPISSASPQCPACGTALPAGELAGLCPACLLKQGISADTATAANVPPFIPPPIAEIALLFPQLEILRLLGKGGMGAVYLARQPSLDRMVALKILPARNPADPTDLGFAERFTREARALAKLNHPNIVTVHEFGQAGALHYFIMEYVDGVTLRQLQKSRTITPHEALQIVPQLCDALQYAHDESVVHRDIKPENVLIDRKGRVKIADFGLAKILGLNPGELRLTGEGQVMGTPHYMSPEQIEHPLEVDHRSDIYSLGVVFYEMLTGELPLGRFAPPSRKVQIDVRLDDVVLRTLEKEPERRYQQISEVKTRVASITQTPGAASVPPILPTAENPDKPLMDAAAQVKWPAIGLIVVSTLNWLILLPGILFMMALAHPSSRFRYIAMFAMFAILANTLVFIGGFRMKRLESWGMGIVVSVLAMLIPPANWLGVPVAIWSLVVLSRRPVREAFLARRTVSLPASPSPAPKSQKNNWFIPLAILVPIVLLVGIPILAIMASIALPAFAKARERAQQQAAHADAMQSMQENWSPFLKEGEKPDPTKIHQEAKKLMEKGDYEGSLQRYLWFFNHALEYDPGQSGVRLSFVLSDWAELGRRYPKAKQALVAILDADLEKFNQGNGYFQLFMEISSLNQYLHEEDKTLTLFKSLADPALATQCFPIVEPLLVKNGDYALCMSFIAEPQAAFDSIKEKRDRMKELEKHTATMMADSQKRSDEVMAKIKKDHPEYPDSVKPYRVSFPEFADKNFVNETRQLIKILVHTQHQAEAENIQTQAIAVLDNPRLHSAITDAQAK